MRLALLLLLLPVAARADTTSDVTPAPRNAGQAVIPTANFPAARYETLWKNSPFSVATPEGPTDTSPDYQLYGLANVDGVTYASIVDAHTNEHFLISSDKATRGLTLGAITRQPGTNDTYATVTKDGQVLTLKLASVTTAMPGGPANGPAILGGQAGTILPNITAPGSGNGFGNGSARPFIHIRRPHITLPPPPGPASPPPGGR